MNERMTGGLEQVLATVTAATQTHKPAHTYIIDIKTVKTRHQCLHLINKK